MQDSAKLTYAVSFILGLSLYWTTREKLLAHLLMTTCKMQLYFKDIILGHHEFDYAYFIHVFANFFYWQIQAHQQTPFFNCCLLLIPNYHIHLPWVFPWQSETG